jgi:protein-S-isoprenylcysteine O-methyltransferase Ste14
MSSENPSAHHHKRHAGRDDLTGEYRLGDTIQLILLVIFLAIWILDSFVFHYGTFLTGSIPWYVNTPLGIMLLVTSLILSGSGMKMVFGEQQETPHVITQGVFSIIRHPIYLGAILAYAGLCCMTLSLPSFALLVIIIPFYRYISRYEERLLIKRFGDEYSIYMRKVSMLFPLKPFRKRT